jgi:hypothetical protein
MRRPKSVQAVLAAVFAGSMAWVGCADLEPTGSSEIVPAEQAASEVLRLSASGILLPEPQMGVVRRCCADAIGAGGSVGERHAARRCAHLACLRPRAGARCAADLFPGQLWRRSSPSSGSYRARAARSIRRCWNRRSSRSCVRCQRCRWCSRSKRLPLPERLPAWVARSSRGPTARWCHRSRQRNGSESPFRLL